ncbi:MAG: glutamine synthetase family protein, partial [Chloroflexota bacterium]
MVEKQKLVGTSLDERKAYVLKLAKEHDVKFIWLWFTDILGFLKSFALPVEEMEGALSDGVGFDGSSIEGFCRIDESDMVAMPDPDTFALLPWMPKEHAATARLFCDVLTPEGKPFDGDPRQVLRRNLKKAAELGYTFYTGPELEYFYFKNGTCAEPIDVSGYFDMSPPDLGQSLRRDTVLTLEEMGIPIDKSHHEVATSQHEIDMRYTDALTMADNVMTYRLVVKQIALNNGVYATFMPKPVFGINGSGMHVHQSLFKGDTNAFFDPKGKYNLSKPALQFVAGLLKYAPEFTAVTSQWVNSYKRLVPGYEAPVYLSWARRNRSDLIRVPEYKPGQEKATRFEIRSPDPACNPYLTFSVLLAAGLAGIKEGLEPPEPVEENVYEMSEAERKRRGIGSLPASLIEAVQLTEKSKLVKEA